MLKKVLRAIWQQLLKVEWIKREVEAYKFERRKREHRERWAKMMSSGTTVRPMRGRRK